MSAISRWSWLLASLPLLGLSPAFAHELGGKEHVHPDAPPPTATLAIPGPQLRLAKNGNGQVIELRDIDDPGNPYAGKYDEADRWSYEHYVPEVNKQEQKHFGG